MVRRRGTGEKQAHARQRGTFATSRKENQGGTGRANGGVGEVGGRPCWMQWSMGPSVPAFLAENAEGGPGCPVVIPVGGSELGSVHSARPHWLVSSSGRRDRLS